MGLFIIVIMIGSILGFGSYFTQNQPQQDTTPPDPNLPDSTAIQMNAEKVEVKVVEVVPKILFSAYTDEADIQKIDKKIALVEGIYKIDSKYRQVPNTTLGTSLVYAAEISFQKEKSVSEMVEKINNATEGTLFQPFSFENVLASITYKTVKFSNTQGFDLNYEFEDPLILAYVVPGTTKGDKLLVNIDASFTGNTMINSVSAEAIPEPFLADLNSVIEEKLPIIIFGGYFDYSDFVEENALKEQIVSLDVVSDANVFSPKPEKYFLVSFEAETDFNEEFNEFLSDHNELFTSIEVSALGTGYSAQIYFSGENAKELEEQVKAFVEEKGALNVSVTESRSQANASIELNSTDTSTSITEITSLMQALNFSQLTFQQKAMISFDSIFDEYGREFIPDEKTIIDVYVNVLRNPGEEVELKVYVVPNETRRKAIIAINAAEE
jgi:hypothetical protein